MVPIQSSSSENNFWFFWHVLDATMPTGFYLSWARDRLDPSQTQTPLASIFFVNLLYSVL